MTLCLATLAILNPRPAPAQAPTNDPQARAVEVLRQTVAGREGKPAAATPAPAATVGPEVIPPELEQQYLTGKITAKEFQRALQESRKNPPKPVVVARTNDPRVLESLRSAPPPAAVPKTVYTTVEPVRGATGLAPRIVPSDEPKPVEPPPLSPAAQSQFSEVEKKMDELMRLKAEREQSQTNTPAATTAQPKTKRERLDDLLRQLVAGKITETQYKEQREKVVAGPD